MNEKQALRELMCVISAMATHATRSRTLSFEYLLRLEELAHALRLACVVGDETTQDWFEERGEK